MTSHGSRDAGLAESLSLSASKTHLMVIDVLVTYSAQHPQDRKTDNGKGK